MKIIHLMRKLWTLKKISDCCIYEYRAEKLPKVLHYCCILTSDPAKHAIPKTAEVAYSIGVGERSWQYGTGINPTVQSQTDAPEEGDMWTAWQLFPFDDDQNIPFQRRRKWIFLWPFMGRDWVDVELLYNSVHRKFNEFGVQRVGEWCCRENSTQQRAGPPGLRLSNTGERERHTAMSGGAGEVNMLQFCSVSNSLLHTTLSNQVRGIFF